jgi:ABC-type antimicrobial peptide transport system permease subunit
MDEWIAANGAQPRVFAGMLSIFAALALIIAALGVFSVLAHAVAQGTGEIGLRMALGARAERLVAQFLREGLTLSGLGIALGMIAALAAGSLLESLLFDVTTRDVTSYAFVAGALLIVSAIACAIPARRAVSVDPVTVLRGE